MVRELDCQKQINGDSGANVKRLEQKLMPRSSSRRTTKLRGFPKMLWNASETCEHSEE
ncbi:unnamed protein product, partial [Brassica rapa]